MTPHVSVMDDIQRSLTATFRAIAGPHKGDSFVLRAESDPSEFVVTRKSREVVGKPGIYLIRDREVSAAHAVVLLRAPNHVSIQQIKSSNGTRVFKSRSATSVAASGVALTDGGPPAPIDAGSVVELGSSLLELVSVSVSPERSASPPPPDSEASVTPGRASAAAGTSLAPPPVLPLAERDAARTAFDQRPKHERPLPSLPVGAADLAVAPAAATTTAARAAPPLPSLSPLLLAALDIGAAQAGAEVSARLGLAAVAQPAALVGAAAPGDLRLVARALQHALAAVRRAVAQAEPPPPPKQDVITLSDSASPSPPRRRAAVPGLFSFASATAAAAHHDHLITTVAAPGKPAAPGKRDRKATATKPAKISKARQLAVDALTVAPAGAVTMEAGGAKRKRKAVAGIAVAAAPLADLLEPRPALDEERREAVAELFPPSVPRCSGAATVDVSVRPAGAVLGAEEMLLLPSRVAGAERAAATGPTLWCLAGAGRGGGALRAEGSAALPQRSPLASGAAALLSQTFLPPPYTQSAYDTELLGGSGRRGRLSAAPQAEARGHGSAREVDPGSPPPRRAADRGVGTPPLVIELALPEPAEVSRANDANDLRVAAEAPSDRDGDDPLPPAAIELLRTTSPAGLQALRTAYPDFEAAASFICRQPAARLTAGRDAMSAELAAAGTDMVVERALRFFIDLAGVLLEPAASAIGTENPLAVAGSGGARTSAPGLSSNDRLASLPIPMAAVSGDEQGGGAGQPDQAVADRQESTPSGPPAFSPPEPLELLDSSAPERGAAGSSGAVAFSQVSLGGASHVAQMRSPDLVRALADFGVRPGPRAWMVEQLVEARLGERDLARAADDSRERKAASPEAVAESTAGRASEPTGAGTDLSPAQQIALLIRSRRELHEAVLLFETQPLQALADAARDAGISLTLPALRKILSDLGVSVAEARR